MMIALAALLLLVIFRSCSNGAEKVSYLTEQVRRGNIVRTVNATGEVAAVQLVNVGAQVSGQIETLAVTLGQQVKKGELIAEIDSTTQRNDLEINKAKLKTYEAQLVSRKIALKVAEQQYERALKLKKRDAASDESLENAENTLASARAAVDETTSLIAQTVISVNTAETNLGYTRISAPLDGTVVSIPVEEGQTVNANQAAPTIVHLADLSQMEIRMQISEGDVTKVQPGMRVTYSILSEPNRVFSGELHMVDPGLITLSDGKYTGATDAGTAIYYYGKFVVPNERGILRIGMTTQNTITIAEARDVLIVPTIALRPVGGPGQGSGQAGSSAQDRRGGGQAMNGEAQNRRGGGPGQEGAGQGRRGGQRDLDGAGQGRRGEGPAPAGFNPPLTGGRALVSVMEKGRPVEREIETGIFDSMNTEVVAGLKEGDEVVSAQMSTSELAQAGRSTQFRGAGAGGPRL
ncbi:MAG: efflux RND transporter periplasmic adaptor subunit [Candidatus Adiutrix sp.]|nr:efflux RND transporter periplasmic adaptor subunit [Candidatus Adiutrix sp.]